MSSDDPTIEWGKKYGGKVRPNGEDYAKTKVYGESSTFGKAQGMVNAKGRYPPNCILGHTPECRLLGTKKVKAHVNGSKGQDRKDTVNWRMKSDSDHADPDGTEAVEAFDCAEDCPVRLLDEQSGHSPSKPARNGLRGGSTWHDRKGLGDSDKEGFWPKDQGGGASRFFFCPKASPSERGDFNTHSTVKPLMLMSWLVRLVTRPGGLVLDPFMGSGTTALACLNEGMRFVGVETDPDYLAIAEKRIALARASMPLFQEVG